MDCRFCLGGDPEASLVGGVRRVLRRGAEGGLDGGGGGGREGGSLQRWEQMGCEVIPSDARGF